jgi:hypothetical protein
MKHTKELMQIARVIENNDNEAIMLKRMNEEKNSFVLFVCVKQIFIYITFKGSSELFFVRLRRTPNN